MASTRALDSPLSRVLCSSVRCRRSFFATVTIAGIFDRLAHRSHAVSSGLPSSPLTLMSSRNCSLSRYARYSGRLVAWIEARVARCCSLSRSGFFHNAHRAPLNALDSGVVCPLPPRSWFQTCRRTSSRAPVTQPTAWNASRRCRGRRRPRGSGGPCGRRSRRSRSGSRHRAVTKQVISHENPYTPLSHVPRLIDP